MAQQEKYDSQLTADLYDNMPQGSVDRPLTADDPPCKYLAACWKKLDFTDEIWMMGSSKLMKDNKMAPYLKELPKRVKNWWETKHRKRYSIVMKPNPADVDPKKEINICPQVMHPLSALPPYSSLPQMDRDAAELFLNGYMLHILCNGCPVTHKWMLHYEKAVL